MESEREKERHDPEPPQFRFNHHPPTIRQPLLNLLLPTFAFVQPPFAFTALTATHILAKTRKQTKPRRWWPNWKQKQAYSDI